MAIEVEGPDGSVVEFPDGTPNETIKGAMAKHFGSPAQSVGNQTPEQKTEKLGTIEKGVRAASYGLLSGAEGAMNTLGKAIGADPQKLAKVNILINAGREAMGVTPEEYAPASTKAADPNASFGDRMSYMPRALIESGAPLAVGAAVGGLPGAMATVGATEAGPTIDRVRAEDNTDPNAELTASQKARVGGKVGLDMLMTALGGRATLGATAPVRAVGMEGVKQAAGNVVKAGATDALVGGGSAAADKMLIDGEAPSFNDVAVPALTGATIGTTVRAPGATREAAVSTRFRALGDIEPGSRERVATLLKDKEGDWGRTKKDLEIDLSFAQKGVDGSVRKALAKAKADLAKGTVLGEDAVSQISNMSSPEAAQALSDLNTLNKFKKLDDGGLSNTKLVQAMKPFSKGTNLLDYGSLGVLFAGGHIPYLGHISPELAAGVLGTQASVYGGARAIDSISGASNVAKVITDKFAGSTESPPAPTVKSPSDTPRNPSAMAKAAKKAQDASPPEFYEAVVPGAFQELTVRQPKIGIGNQHGWRQGVSNFIGDRAAALKEMAQAVPEATDALTSLELDWTDNTKTPDGGVKWFKDMLNDSTLDEQSKQKLDDIFKSHEKKLRSSWKKAQ